jgi:predicted ribosome quality control (RQC) complex YloA/Tae2 family protein
MQQHLSYHTLTALASVLNEQFAGGRLIECFSQQKDELTLLLKHNRKTTFLRCSCRADFPFIALQYNFRRFKTNSVNLFSETEQCRIMRFETEPNDRLFYIRLENEQTLVLKMYGTRSNVLYFDKNVLKGRFRTILEEDENFMFPTSLKDIPTDEMTFRLKWETLNDLPENKRWKAIFPTLDRYMINRLMPSTDKWNAYEQLLKELQDNLYYISQEKEYIGFWLYNPTDLNEQVKIKAITGVVEALDEYIRLAYSQKHYYTEKRRVEQHLITQLKKYRGQSASLQKTLDQLSLDRNAEEVGHLLMANLHMIQNHSKEVTLYDFYTDHFITIELDPQLNPQKNAERYYRKYKDDLKKKAHTEQQWLEIQNLLEPYVEAENAFQEVNNLKSLKQFKQRFAHLFEGKLATNKSTRALFREYALDGYQIYVGKNAKNNDELTFGFANKGDLWLHAKDVAGSHVIIRKKGNEKIPEYVLEYAAGLAAFYSKLRNNPLVTVSYTLRKYVRKHKKLAAGEVIVEREDTLLIEPINPNEF